MSPANSIFDNCSVDLSSDDNDDAPSCQKELFVKGNDDSTDDDSSNDDNDGDYRKKKPGVKTRVELSSDSSDSYDNNDDGVSHEKKPGVDKDDEEAAAEEKGEDKEEEAERTSKETNDPTLRSLRSDSSAARTPDGKDIISAANMHTLVGAHIVGRQTMSMKKMMGEIVETWAEGAEKETVFAKVLDAMRCDAIPCHAMTNCYAMLCCYVAADIDDQSLAIAKAKSIALSICLSIYLSQVMWDNTEVDRLQLVGPGRCSYFTWPAQQVPALAKRAGAQAVSMHFGAGPPPVQKFDLEMMSPLLVIPNASRLGNTALQKALG